MAEYIEREETYNVLTEYYHHSTQFQHDALREALSRVPSADVAPVVHCKDCIYKPSYIPPDSEDVWDLSFPLEWQSPCPCYCEDGYYSRMPHDDWFCNFGKRKDGEP